MKLQSIYSKNWKNKLAGSWRISCCNDGEIRIDRINEKGEITWTRMHMKAK